MRNPSLRVSGMAEEIPLIGSGPWLLGSASHCQIRVDDPACDKEQARIIADKEGFLVEPCSAGVPTFLNQRALLGTIDLHDGDSIAFGKCRMTFVARQLGRTREPDGPSGSVALGSRTVIGRSDQDLDLALDHPNVSLRHAMIERDDRAATLQDLGTEQGTFVNGKRVRTTALAIGDIIDIGPFSFRFAGKTLQPRQRSGSAELHVDGVSLEITLPGAKGVRRILDEVDLDIHPGELVCVVGTSGSGKSTLINIMSGRNRPSTGVVTLDERDLHSNFQAMKRDIAFVPQQDVLHEPLLLREALDYVARLRLPDDVSAQARRGIVEEAAQRVDLVDKLETVITNLSGGQKKRASLASELIGRPSLFFLDEVTSGLDEETDREIMALLRRMADERATIVCVTHTLANVQAFAHRLVVMGAGGILTFSGTPQEALTFFGVARLGDVFGKVEATGALSWRDRYRAQATARPTHSAAAISGFPRAPRLPALQGLRQLAVLNGRNARLLIRDTRMLTLAGVQTVLIGMLVGYVFSGYGEGAIAVESRLALLRLLAMIAIWLGCNSAATQIVSELPIFRRERDVNLSALAFVLSKFIVTGLFALAQLLGVILLIRLLGSGVPGGLVQQTIPLGLATLAGTALGLTISALSSSRDQASTIVPLAIVPQLTLGVGLVPVLPDFAQALRDVAISVHWAIEALKAAYIEADGPVSTFLPATGQIGALASVPRGDALAILLAHAAFLLAAAYLIVRRRFDRTPD